MTAARTPKGRPSPRALAEQIAGRAHRRLLEDVGDVLEDQHGRHDPRFGQMVDALSAAGLNARIDASEARIRKALTPELQAELITLSDLWSERETARETAIYLLGQAIGRRFGGGL